MTSKLLVIKLVTLLAGLCAAAPAQAAWPSNGVSVCTQPYQQYQPFIVSDGAGGMIVAFTDRRDGSHYLTYAQRIDGTGVPMWIRDGVLVSTTSGNVETRAIVSDGAYGAIIVWIDDGVNIRAQRIDADGNLLWPDGPAAPLIAASYPENFTAVADGFGGVIVVWQNEPGAPKIRAQRIDAAGNEAWTAGGIDVFTGAAVEMDPCAVSDGSGGVFVAAAFDYGLGGAIIRAQRILLSGVIPYFAVVVSGSSETPRENPAIATDDAGGAFIAWSVDNGFPAKRDIRMIRVDGSLNLVWGSAIDVCTADEDQTVPAVISDGSGNAVVAWQDRRYNESQVYAQKHDAWGSPLWITGGIRIGDHGPELFWPRLLPGNGSDVIVVCADFDSEYVVAQAIDATGASIWEAPGYVGVIATDLNYSEESYDVATDHTGGVLGAVSDNRGIAGEDIFARPVSWFGRLYRAEPTLVSVTDVPGDQGGWIRLTINPSDRDVLAPIAEPVTRYDVWREVQSSFVIDGVKQSVGPLAAPGADGVRIVTLDGRRYLDAAPGGALPSGTWEQVGGFSATQSVQYTFLVPTTADSSASGANDENYFAIAHTADPRVWFSSRELNGHSVDNIPPHVPGHFVVDYYVYGETRLQWDPSTDADFKYYRVYRDTDPGFTPSPASYVHGTTDWTWADTIADGVRYYYKVTAVDMADNESSPAHSAITGAGPGGPPDKIALEQNVPNPFNPSTSISFGVPAAGAVTLVVYDIAGKRVRTLVDGTLPAGYRVFSWNGMDDNGRAVSSGVYFYRLEAGGETITKKMVLLK